MALKCSLLLLLATYACFDARNIYQAVKGEYLESINDLPIVVKFDHNFATILLFWVNHWMFTAHYLKVACMIWMSLTGSVITSQSARWKKLRTMLLTIEAVWYLALLIITILATLSDSKYYIPITWSLLLTIVTFVSFWSMLYIYRQTKALQHHGIFANVSFMIVFVFVNFTCALINIAIIVLDFTIKEEPSQMAKAKDILVIIQSLMFLVLNLMTLSMYWRFSNPLEQKIIF